MYLLFYIFVFKFDFKFVYINLCDSLFEIEIVIGVDYYWDFVMSYKVYGNRLIVVKFKFGYLLFGLVKENVRKIIMDIYKIVY